MSNPMKAPLYLLWHTYEDESGAEEALEKARVQPGFGGEGEQYPHGLFAPALGLKHELMTIRVTGARIFRHAGVGKWLAKSLADQRLEFSDTILPTPGCR